MIYLYLLLTGDFMITDLMIPYPTSILYLDETIVHIAIDHAVFDNLVNIKKQLDNAFEPKTVILSRMA